MQDASTLPDHAIMHNKIYHADSSFWSMWYPPNGYNCRCFVVSLTEEQAKKRLGKDDSLIPEWIDLPDEGWQYNVGAAGLDAWRPDWDRYSERIKRVIPKQLELPKNKKIEVTEEPETKTFKPFKNLKELEPAINSDNILDLLKFDEELTTRSLTLRRAQKDTRALAATDGLGNIYIFDNNSGSMNAYETLRQAIKKGKDLTFKEEYSLEALWHEIMHNRQIHSSLNKGSSSYNFMETVNQWVARRSYDKLLNELNIQGRWKEKIKTEGVGYKTYIEEFDRILTTLKIDETEFMDFMWELHGETKTNDYIRATASYLSNKSGHDFLDIARAIDIISDDYKRNYDAHKLMERWGGKKAIDYSKSLEMTAEEIEDYKKLKKEGLI